MTTGRAARCAIAITIGFAATAAAAPSYAQDAPPTEGVMERLRPAYDAKGIDLGGFRLKPALDVAATVDDNVYRTQNARKTDGYFTIAPSFSLKSQWSRHMLELTGGLTRYQYINLNEENRTGWNVGANGRLDIFRGSALSAGTSYAVLHEPRYSPDQSGQAATPTRYSVFHNEASVTYQPYRFGLTLGGTYEQFAYHSTPLVGGGIEDNSDRDKNSYGGYARASYRVGKGTEVFLRGSYDMRSFHKKIDRNGVNRDSHGYRADAGVKLFLTHLLEGEAFAGYSRQSFKAPLQSVSGFDFGARLNYYATELMTVHLTASRTLGDTTLAGASVSNDQSFGLGVDYELLRNLILQAGGDYTFSDYEGIARRDKYLEAYLNAKYLINRYLSADASYIYSQRRSNVAGQGFTDNSVSLGLHFQL